MEDKKSVSVRLLMFSSLEVSSCFQLSCIILLLTPDFIFIKALVKRNVVEMPTPSQRMRSNVASWLVKVTKSTDQSHETILMMFYIFDFLLASIFTNGNKELLHGNFVCGLGVASLIISSKLNEISGKSLTSQSFHLFFKKRFMDAIELRSMKCLFEENCSLNPNLSPMSFVHLFASSLKDTLSLELSQQLIDHAAELICQFFARSTSSNHA